MLSYSLFRGRKGCKLISRVLSLPERDRTLQRKRIESIRKRERERERDFGSMSRGGERAR